MNAFISLGEQMGVPLAPEKTQDPTIVLPFLGIILDTVELEARLPDDKLAKLLELFPVMTAVVVWGGGAWANQNVRFFTDNEALASVINKQTSRDPHIVTLLRRMILTCLTFNINFMACHVPGRLNSLADSLSRGQLDAFRLLAPWTDARPTNLPAHCLPQHL
ncbi:hypothetical protein NP493_205g03044 [Ridgeia piscesae]|uniref:Uncharacterized protein n=1 Tax=Ridgeia piscesae TaxID=27915 RepID=A0AAD9P1A0_RIDPI|nr:hypothetical protein NP493_205g03044 [Ridgeia piscesae]